VSFEERRAVLRGPRSEFPALSDACQGTLRGRMGQGCWCRTRPGPRHVRKVPHSDIEANSRWPVVVAECRITVV
jgi:hypothetical protein